MTTTYFQFGNGDMTLITLESGRRILVHSKITLQQLPTTLGRPAFSGGGLN